MEDRLVKITTMKKILLTLPFFFVATIWTYGQVKIKDGSVTPTTSALPNSNAILDLESNNKGLLLPRVALSATANPAPLSAHVKGIVVYDTVAIADVTPGIYYNDGTRWVQAANAAIAASGWNITGNAGTRTGTTAIGSAVDANYLGTTESNLVIATGGIKRLIIDGNGNAFGGGAGTTHYSAGSVNSFDWGEGIVDSANRNAVFGVGNRIAFGNGKGAAFGESQTVAPLIPGASDNTSNYLVAGKGNTLLSAAYSGVFGANNIVNGEYTFMAGQNNTITANAYWAVVFGLNDKVSTPLNTVVGTYNVDTVTALFSVGNGTGSAARSNAITVTRTGSLGINNVNNPNSTLQVNGSVSLPIRTITASSTLTDLDYTVIKTGAAPVVITLPDPSTCAGRVYELVSYTGASGDVSLSVPVQTSNYGQPQYGETDLYQLVSNAIGASAGRHVTIKIQSDGINWYSIGL